MKSSNFHTRSIANQGEKMFLTLPDGEPTTEFLIIRHFDCDHYRKAKMEAIREIPQKEETFEQKAERQNRIRLSLLKSLIAGWSFEQEATPEAIEEFLTECPSIAEEVDKFSGQRENFFMKAPKS